MRKGREGRSAPGREARGADPVPQTPRVGRGHAEDPRPTLKLAGRCLVYEQFLQTRPFPAAMACSTEPERMVWERLSDGQLGVVWYTLPPGVQ